MVRSSRTRIVAWFVLLLLLVAGTAVLVTRQLLLLQLTDEFERDLRQEISEMRTLSEQQPPPTALPPEARVRTLFDAFLTQTILDRDEAFLTFVEGDFYRAGTGTPLEALHEDPQVLEAVGGLDRSTRGTLSTSSGRPFEYLAVPVDVDGRRLGLAVVAVFPETEVAEVADAVRAFLGAFALVLVLASFTLWGVAGRILAPMQQVTETARRISDSDLSGRIHLSGSEGDETAELARTFNAMLDRLEEAFAAQRDFVNDAGHELRTPITIVRGHLELDTLSGEDPAERDETRRILLDELDRMSRMVQDLLVLATAEQPDFLERAPVDLAGLTRELAAKARPLAQRRWQVDAVGEGSVHADRQRLTQAAMQLVENAVRHTDEGQVVAIGSALGQGTVRLWVRDTGVGICEHEQQRVFARFAHGGDRRRRGGAGLGLAIVKAIAAAHSGGVELRSRVGRGTTVTLTLPAGGNKDRRGWPGGAPSAGPASR